MRNAVTVSELSWRRQAPPPNRERFAPATVVPRQPEANRFSRLAVIILAGLLGVAAGVQAVVGLFELLPHAELIYGEAINLGQALRVAHGQPLYQPVGLAPYTITEYTPLYYWIVGALQSLGGSGFLPGRIVSLLATGASVIMVGALAARGRSAALGWLAALIFLALGLPGSGPVPAISLNKEDGLALAFALGALWLLCSGTDGRRVAAAAVLAAAALLTKQTLIFAAVSGALWLWQRSRWLGFLYASVCGGLVVAVCVAVELTSGAFLANAVGSNLAIPWSALWLRANLGQLAFFQLGALILAGTYAFRHRPLGLLGLAFLATFPDTLALAKEGGGSNHWTAVAAFTAIFASWQIHEWVSGKQSIQLRAVALACAAQMSLGAIAVSAAGVGTIGRLSSAAAENASFDALVERVRTQPGPVLADPLDVVALAGKGIYFEPLIYSILFKTAGWDPAPLIADVCSGRIRLAILGPDDTDPMWPAPLVAAFRAGALSRREMAGRQVYELGPSTTGRCSA